MRDAEIGEDRRVVVTEQHVVGLDVAMDDAAGMGHVQRRAQLGQDGQALLQAQAKRQALAQAAAVEVFHTDEVALRGLDHVMHGDDIAMAQPSQGMGFVHEALRHVGVAVDAAIEHLQRDLPFQGQLGRQVDHGHRAPPQLAFELVTRKLVHSDPSTVATTSN